MDVNTACSLLSNSGWKITPSSQKNCFKVIHFTPCHRAGLSKNRCWEMWRWNLGWRCLAESNTEMKREGGGRLRDLPLWVPIPELSAQPLYCCFTQSLKTAQHQPGGLYCWDGPWRSKWLKGSPTAGLQAPPWRKSGHICFQPHTACSIFGQKHMKHVCEPLTAMIMGIC